MSMEIEQQQSQVIQQFVSQASTLNASALVSLIVQATSHPSLFAFSEILSLPTILQLQGTENAAYLDLLRLFAHGTWREYKINASLLPKLVPDQILKLKQLTVLTLAETTKVLSYDILLGELELSNVRELEDFLINDCMYSGIVKGKLDQLRRCFQVQFAAGRDLMHGQLGSMLETLTNWLDVSNNMLPLIEEKIEWASQMCKSHEDHQKDVKNRIEQAKEAFHANSQRQHISRGLNIWGREDFYHFPDGEMDHEVDSFRSKRRRSPNSHGRRRPTHH